MVANGVLTSFHGEGVELVRKILSAFSHLLLIAPSIQYSARGLWRWWRWWRGLEELEAVTGLAGAKHITDGN